MRVFVTGATGFIGKRLVDAMLARGWSVLALARSPERAKPLTERGVDLVMGDLTSPQTYVDRLKDVDAVAHLAAVYEFGATDPARLFRVNVDGTRDVLRAAGDAGVQRIVYCSSVTALGSGPPGSVGDETREHHGRFPTLYEESKSKAHHVARELAAGGLPVVTVMPGGVYGAGGEDMIAAMLRLYAKKLLVACPFRHSEVSWVYVDDVGEGIAKALEAATPGTELILGGDNDTVAGLLTRPASLTKISPPRVWIPASVTRLSLPVSPVVSRLLGQQPAAVRDSVQTLEGASWMFSSARAEREIGYSFRPIEEGMVQTVEAFRTRAA